ncbi:type IV pilus modification PilV family protein [Hydrogenophaga sp. OTU3427]|uniref:type IV pilus modification PilV family protein n=1 Tax=Hydrogenophaga sp. OTU3427 TaxID=3043856 RepID=UPI00313B1EA3
MKRMAGFSLLELLVALSIMAMSLGMLYRSMGASARQSGDMDVQQRAVLLAQSLLASREALTGTGWNEDGQEEGYVWRVRSAPYASGATDPEAVKLHEVRLTIERADDVRPLQWELVTLLPERKPFPGEVQR